MPIIIVLGVLGLILLANAAAASPRSDLARLIPVLLAMILLSTLLMAGLLLIITLFSNFNQLPNFTPQLTQAYAWPLLGASLWGLAILFKPVRHFLTRFMPLNPGSPVHTLALLLAGYLVANTLVTLNQGGLEALAENAEAVSIGSLLIQGITFVAAAVLGVGLGVRRKWEEIIERLGLRPLKWADFSIAGKWLVLLYIVLFLTTATINLLNPRQMELLDSVNLVFLGDLDTVGEWFILGLTSGIGEELLFRGAVQPAFGIIPTALLFAVLHIQYGFSPITLFVFVLGLVFGIIRQRHGTTTAILVHFGYNFAQGLLALLAQSLLNQSVR